MLTLYLLRHGKAINPESSVEDFDRSLNKKGIAQINQIGIWLEELKPSVDEIISSAAVRTKQTAEIANHFIGLEKINYYKELYLASQSDIINHLSENAKGKNILYVGHNFGISDLAGYLIDQPISMSTGMIIQIEFNLSNWNELGKGAGKMTKFIQPNIYLT